MANTNGLQRVLHRLSDANKFRVLVHARLLVLRQCVVGQYCFEGIYLFQAHWVKG